MDLSSSPNALAIIGMECRLPGADGLEQYWQLIRDARSALGPLPEDRLDRDLYFDPKRGVVGKSYTDLGGVVSSRPVDFSELPLADELIRGQDPAHQILCEVAARAIRDAGYDPFALPNRNVGVYIGHTGGSNWISDLLYSTIVAEGAQYLYDTPLFQALGDMGPRIVDEVIARTRRDHGGRRPSENLDLSALAAASLISRAFSLAGPYMVVDAACASSMQAMAVGIRSLLHGRVDMALVGGASYCKSDSLVLFSAAQSVSHTGSCPFGAAADGLVAAEGYVVLALKTLERAVRDGDRIRAVIRGLGVSSDGKGKSLWAPREEGQKLAVMQAYGTKLDASRLQYIEAHATSTRLGDATEIRALGAAMHELLPRGAGKIPIGSAKGNVGHTLETAGMAGMVRAILAMEHGVIPPAVGDGYLNEEIPWEESPFYVPFKEEPWPSFEDGHPRRAAVNAFGIGGLNVHVVIDEFVGAAPARRSSASAAPAVPATHPTSRQISKSEFDTAVAVIGCGCVLPGAQSISALWDLLMSGRDPKSPLPKGRWNADLFLQKGGPATWKVCNTWGGYIDDFSYDWKRHKVPPLQVARADPLQFMLLEAADQAFSDAGYGNKPFDRKRVGAVVGTVFGGEFGNQLTMGLRLPEFSRTLAQVLREKEVPEDRIEETGEQFRRVLLEHMPALLDETGSFTSSTLASRITKTFDLMGGAFAMDAGSCSGHFALQASVDLLLDGTNDMVVCTAGQRGMDVFAYEWMGLAGILSPGTPRPPFGEQAEGLVPGEGCAVVVLKRLADAQRDGDRVRAVLRGFGACRSSNAGTAIETAVQSALRDADLGAEAISVVEAHGTGLPENDQQELAAIDRVLGKAQRAAPLVVGTSQSPFGETAGAAGIVSLLKVAQALQQGVFPGTVGFTRPQPALAQMADRLRVSSKAQEVPPYLSSNYRAAGITGWHEDMAFHVVVDNGEVPPDAARSVDSIPQGSFLTRTTPAENPWRLIRFSATDFASMRHKLSQAMSDVAETFRQGGPDTFQPSDVMRMAVVADSVETASKRLRLAIDATSSQMPVQTWQDHGVVLVERVFPRRKVAALFPGQGSQYAGMLQELAEVSHGARQVLADAQAIMAGKGWSQFEQIAWEDPETLGHDPWTTQVSLLVADMMAYAAARDLGLRPDLVGGHSYGEFPALVAAGAWNLKEAMLATRVRCDAIAASKSVPSSMLSVLAPQDRVRDLIAQHNDQLWVSAVNGPDQVVVGGAIDAVQRFEQKCCQKNIITRQLNVPLAFHTELMNDTCEILERGLADRDIRPVTTPLISSVTARFVADPNDIRQGLVRQMTVPALYQQLVQRLYGLGVRVFLELGPSNVLTQLTRRILVDTDDVFLASMDHRKRSGQEQLARFQALLEVHDLSVKPPVARPRASRPTPASQLPQVAAVQSPETLPATSEAATARRPEPTIRFADATERRRARHRLSAGVQTTPPTSGGQEQTATEPALTQPVSEPSRPADVRVDTAKPSNEPVVGTAATAAPITEPHVAAAPVAVSEPPVPAVGSIDLEEFLVSFVVEQTGYPAEIVELDADLEADLGIDSIKKAQLFGELGEHFSIEPDENLTLDDFPTLGHVRDYLLAQPGITAARGKAGGAGQVAIEPVPPMTEPQMAAAPVAVSEPPAPAVGSIDLEAFLVNFVVEQTGYPAEIVELDADLEADLGIDSIKKAQLFGELGEHFSIEPDENLTLDDFPTLGHVRDYLLAQPGITAARGKAGGAGQVAIEPVPPAPITEPQVTAAPVAVSEPPVPAASEEIPVLELEGNAYEVGFQRGRAHAPAIQKLLRRHADRVETEWVISIAQHSGTDVCTPAEWEELCGMAHGANVLKESLIAVNLGIAHTGLLPVGCHWACRKPRAQDSNAGGLSMYLPDSVPIVLEVRRFQQGNDYVAATLPGLLGALGGINETGLSAAVWSAESPVKAGAIPRAVCLDIERLLVTCSHLDEAVEVCRGWDWPANVWLTLGCADLTCVTQVHWEPQGTVHVEKHPWEVALVGAPAIPVTLSREDLLADAIEYLKKSARMTAHALSGLGKGHWLVLTGGTSGLVASSGDDIRLAQSSSTQTIPIELDVRVPDRSLLADSSQPQLDGSTHGLVTQRYVMRLVEASQGIPSQRSDIRGPVLILGSSATAVDLEAELQRRSIPVRVVSSSRDPAKVRVELESLSQDTLPRTLILATALDERCSTVSDFDRWKRRRQPGLMSPYQVAQAWVARITEEGLAEEAALIGVVDLGGDLGLSGEMGSPEGGAITGLMKAINNEFQDLFVRVIDIGATESDVDAAAAILEECSIRDGEVEIVLRTLQRMVLRPALQPRRELPLVAVPGRGGVWVVTGGARGVTAVLSYELGRRFGLRLHLIGASSVEDFDRAWLDFNKSELKAAKTQFMVAARKRGDNPALEWAQLEKSIEIERNMRRMRDDGVDATYHACDVSDQAAMRRLLEQIRRSSGPITGLVHGAGFEAACRFDQKQLEKVNRTLAAKNDGAVALMALTAGDPIEYFIGFGSTSGRLGGVGQTDYSMANDLLAKQIDRLRRERPSVRATVFHWYAWDEVGMAARPESRFALQAFGMTLMPLQEGIDHFIGEIEAGLAEPEVLICEPLLCPVTVDANAGLPLSTPAEEAPATPPFSESSLEPTGRNTYGKHDWATFLVNFVVEQTGYPPEIVELDADLEADLGIDSIKKAQMFGEIGEQFEIEPDENLTLDDFPTLRHVIEYLKTHVTVAMGGAKADTPLSGVAAAGKNLPGARAAHAATPNALADASTASAAQAVMTMRAERSVDQPLIESLECHNGKYIAHCVLDPTRDTFLLQHQMNGIPVLPAVISLELFAQTAAAIAPGSPSWHFRDVDISQALKFPRNQQREVKVIAERRADGWNMKLVGDVLHRTGAVLQGEHVHVAGRVVTGSPQSDWTLECGRPRFPMYPMEYLDNAPMFHGPAFRTLEELLFQRDGGWGHLVAPDKAELAEPRSQTGWLIPSALLDGTLVACSVYSEFMCGPRAEIPAGFEQLELVRDPADGERCTVRLLFHRNDERNSWFDFVLFGTDDAPILRCRGLRNVVLTRGDKQ